MQHAGQNYLILNLYKPKIWLNALLEAFAFIRLHQWIRSTLRDECSPDELKFRGRRIALTQEGMDTLLEEFRTYGEIFTHCYALVADAMCKQFCPATHHEELGFCPYTITCAYYPLYRYHPATEEFLQDWEVQRCLAYADFDVEDAPLPSEQEHSIECETTMS